MDEIVTVMDENMLIMGENCSVVGTAGGCQGIFLYRRCI
jgi:hypothetical protein